MQKTMKYKTNSDNSSARPTSIKGAVPIKNRAQDSNNF